MITDIILAFISFGIFIAFNAISIKEFGLEPSLSDYYYSYKNKYPKFSFAFPLMMCLISMTLILPLIDVTRFVSFWSKYLIIFPYLTALCIALVGVAAAFRDNLIIRKIHMISAKVCAGVALAFDMIICWKLMWIVPSVLLIIAAIAHGTKTAKSSRDYWWEMVAFYSTFITVIVQLFLIYFNIELF